MVKQRKSWQLALKANIAKLTAKMLERGWDDGMSSWECIQNSFSLPDSNKKCHYTNLLTNEAFGVHS